MIGLKTKEFQDITLSVGTHRGTRRLSPLEVARLLESVLKAGTSRKECAETLGIGTTQLSTFLKLLSLRSEIQHLADWRGTKNASISFSTLAELARLPLDDQIRAAEAVLRHDLKWKEVIQLTQISNRSGQTIDECIASVLKLRPQIETRYLFVGAIISDVLKTRFQSMTQSERDRLISRTLSQIAGPDYGARGRLSDTEFTILSHHDLPQLLDLTSDQLEQNVNCLLETLSSQA